MIQYVAGTDEIEITVLSEVHQSWAIGFGLVFGQQFVVIRQRIRDFYLQATWVTLITIGADQGQLHPGAARIIEWGCVPQSFIKPFRATVQMVRTVEIGRASCRERVESPERAVVSEEIS